MDIKKFTAVSGIGAFFMAVAGSMILGIMKPGYDPLMLTISELGESGGVNSFYARVLFIIFGVFEIIFAAGLFIRLKGSLKGIAGSVAIGFKGLFDSIGSGVFPCDFGGLYESFSGKMHFIVSIIGVAMMLIAPLLVYDAMKKDGSFKDIRIISAARFILASSVLLFTLSFFTGLLPGLSQRIMYYLYYLWLLFVSIKILGEKKAEV